MGLIGAFAGGAAPGISDAGKQLTDYGIRDQLAQRELAAREAMGKRLAEYGATTAAGVASKGHDYRMDEIAAGKDPNAKAISDLTLKRLQEDDKIPSSVKTAYTTLDTTLKAQQSALFKAQSEGTFDAASPGAISLQTNIENTKGEMSKLIEPYLPDIVKGKKPAAAGIDELFPTKTKAAAPPGLINKQSAPAKTEVELANEQFRKTGIVPEHYKKVPYGRGQFKLEKMVQGRGGWR